MFRTATIALALAATTAAPQASAQKKLTEAAAPSDFGCAVRMMYMGSRARDDLKNPSLAEDKRASYERLNTETRRAFLYYIGRLGPEFSATNRSEEGKKLFSEMLANPKDKLAAEIAVCMANAEKAEKDALAAMKSPPAK